ncbi:6-bladed beta-propeller [Parabacteroides sp. AF14-59]|uniref:6-bladed beta-propeller n=1 Tax=Parabacteroides sp. AF14-59 TaxID=2292240 RepID=UPI000EFF698C|nr:6-bladed beta-propeller [Parabacteroides sp. AF14-59]RHR91212.1 6-bladed beta-propeller [Parabacteroides sp. AF14-59]
MNKLLYFLIVIISWSCTQNSPTEKFQHKRNNIMNIHDKIEEIQMEDILISNISRIHLIKDYLVIGDYKAPDKLINIFDKKTFKYITSSTYQGLGPGEIANMGYIGVDEDKNKLFVSDHGKQKIFYYDLDSILKNPDYEPKEKINMNGSLFPDKYQYINDTLSISLIIEPTGSSGYNQSVAKWNMSTGEIIPMKYEHPNITQKRINIAANSEINNYVECYSFYDLMTICDLDGNLKFNIYGPNWKTEKSKKQYYGKVIYCKNNILALYSGENNFVVTKDKGIKSNHPTQIIIFDKNGDYIQTLETGYQIIDFCYDKDNNRIIMVFNDNIQFGYLDLNGII